MIIKHQALVEKAKELLRQRGFRESEIFVEYGVPTGRGGTQRADVAGIRKDLKVGIECGSVHKSLDIFKQYFDEVIILPYVTVAGNKFHCSFCGHTWTGNVAKPRCCPKCKKYIFYDEDKKNTKIELKPVNSGDAYSRKKDEETGK